MTKRALITGLTGQDGSYLAELLLSKDYEVYGLRRRSSSFNTGRIDHLLNDFRHDKNAKLFLEYGDLADASSLARLLYRLHPDEIYNLGAQSHVHVSFEMPEYTGDVTGLGSVRILEAVRESGVRANFVTRKITQAIARIHCGLQKKLYLGNLDAKRDWGYAPEYVEAMWMMLQQDTPDDYVIATGETHSVREFVIEAFAHAGLDWEKHVEIDPVYYRPAEVDNLRGDASKARVKLGWTPKVGFDELVRIMVDADIESLEERLRRGEEYIKSS
jgi:GDP-D-mannose dehydratase